MNHIKPKLFTVMKGYNMKQFSKDLIAGIIVAIIALPLSIALAIASGVGPEQGIYTAIVAGFFISFFGGSRVQIGGPTAAFVLIIYGIIAEHGTSGLATATIMAGIIMILMGIFKLGNLIKYIPTTITIGFTFGIAVTIFVGQLKDFFGMDMGALPSEFIDKVVAYGKNIGTISWLTFGIGMLALLIQIFWPKVTQIIPGSLIAIIVTTLLVKLLKLPVLTIGDLYTIKAGLPTFVAPDFSFTAIRQLISPAFTIAILASIESLLSCVVSDGMIGSKHRSNAELVGQGIGNIMSALFGGIPATGAIARTAANVKNGGRTPIAGIVHALTLLLISLFLMPYASMIPMTTLAAVLIMVAYNMSGWKNMIKIIKTAPLADIIVLVVTALLTIIFDLVIAIEVGMVLAAFLFMKKMSDVSTSRVWKDKGISKNAAAANAPEIDSTIVAVAAALEEDKDISDSDETEHMDKLKDIPKNAIVYEIFGPMFFAAANEFVLEDNEKDKNVLILRMSNVPAMDISGVNNLSDIYETCKKRNMTLLLSHVNPQPRKVIDKAGLTDIIGKENFCDTIAAALKKAEELA